MRDLNRRFRGINRPTDVLSFRLEAPRAGPRILTPFVGQLVICPHYAQEREGEYRFRYPRSLLELTAHGFLHLLGYDHHGERERRRMERLTDHLLGSMRSISRS